MRSAVGSSVDRACNKLLACSRFTGDENGRVTPRNFGDAREYSLQSWGSSDNLFEHRGLVDFFTQSDIFTPQSLLSSSAVFNIGTSGIPSRNLSLVVAHRVVKRQKPAITSIAFAQAQLQLETSPTRDRTIKMGYGPFQVIRMNELIAIRCLPPLFKGTALVIEQDAVSIKTFATGSEYRNMLRREIQYLPEL